MGTKIEQALDPLAASTNSNNSFTLQYRGDDWSYLQARNLNKFQKTNNSFSDSMDRMLEKHNIESIKKTMQIHEEIFKHQVQELHRLYGVQKRSMGELKEESRQNSIIWSSSEMNNSQFINQRNINYATTQTNSGCILHFQNVIDDARERSESCSGETLVKMAKAGARFDLERPAALEDNYISTAISVIDEERAHTAGTSNKMSIDNDSDDNEDSEVELTLSIGASSSSNSSKNKKKSKGYQLGCLDLPASFKSDRGEDSSCPNTPMSSSSATFDQEKKMPRWLFGLSINRS